MSKSFQKILRDILREPEAIEGRKSLSGKRVLGGRGSYWFGTGKATGGSDGENGGSDKEPPSGSGDGSNGGGSGGGGSGSGGGGSNGGGSGGGGDGGSNGDGSSSSDGGGFDPSTPPKVGDPAPSMDLHDCNTGQCVSVNFSPDMNQECESPPLPEEWTAWTARPYWFNDNKHTFNPPPRYFNDLSAALAYVSGAIPAGQSVSGKDARSEAIEKRSETFYAGSGYYKYEVGGRKKSDPTYFSGSVVGGKCKTSYTTGKYPLPACVITYEEMKKNQKPPTECVQIQATQTGFEAVCADDPRMPPQLSGGEFTAFELCDKDGNKVQVSRHGVGWKIDHPKYTATVGKDFRIDHVSLK